MSYFREKRIRTAAFLIVGFLLTVAGSQRIQFDWILMITHFPAAITRLIQLYLPPDFSELGRMIQEMGVTVLIALAAAATGMILAFFAALAISARTSKNKTLTLIIRMLASLTRNIPEGVWAIVLLMCFWYGEFLAYLVMSIISFGFLARVYADAMDEASMDCIEALEATGASYWQIIFNAVVPETLPALISWSLYAAENNIRSSTIIGMLAGGGIGYLIGNYRHFRQFQSLLVAIVLVVAAVLIFDQISAQIRRRILQ